MALDILNVLCPECGKNLKYIAYNAPDEIYTSLYKTRQVFFGNNYEDEKNLKEEDRLKYHCFKCNKSYSENFKRVVEEEYDPIRIKNAPVYLDYIIKTIANCVLEDLDLNDKLDLINKPEYNQSIEHYIKFKYLYNGKHGLIIDYDLYARKIFDQIINELRHFKFPKYDYIYVSVIYYDSLLRTYDGLMYYYKTKDKDIFKGDIVEVDRAGEKIKAQVAQVDYVKKNKVPYPLNKTKDIIRKLTPEEAEQEEYKDYKGRPWFNEVTFLDKEELQGVIYKNVVAIFVSEQGSMGDRNAFHAIMKNSTHYYNHFHKFDFSEEEFYKVFPVMKNIKYSLEQITDLDKGWNWFNVGFGNYLIVRNKYYKPIKEYTENNLGEDWEHGELYHKWVEIINSIIQE